MSRTRVESWLVASLTDAFSSGKRSGKELRMPPFQRGVVWSASKQSELIRSLKAGYPIGSLLFYKQTNGAGNVEVNLLIDGLQRTTAIRSYTAQPLSYMELGDLDREPLNAFATEFRARAGVDLTGEAIHDAISKWMKDTKTLDPSTGFDAFGLVSFLNEITQLQTPVLLDKDLAASANAFIKSILEECDISAIEVPVLFYEGPESELPEIFERINATGTKLSKYEIFAASWVNQQIRTTNEKVKDAIRRRYYTILTEENISINGVRPDGMPHQLSLFDYLFGLGKVLAEKFPLLFGDSEDPTSMTSIAFSLATVCYGLPVAAMRQLPTKFERDRDGNIDPSSFEDALIESAEFVNQTLAPFIGLKLNAERPGSGAHSDLQIASMVARAFVGRYSTATWEAREGSQADRERLRRLLPQHYLLEILQQSWRGSGDSRLMTTVWEQSDHGADSPNPPLASKHYLRSFTRDEFERILDQWFSEQILLNQRSRAYVTMPAKAFLKFVYSSVVTVMAESKERFELDHVFPVSRLADRAKADEDGWPISAVSNLALFDWQTNREKNRLDLVQYIEKQSEADRQKRRQAIERYLLLDLESAAIPVDSSGLDVLEREEYTNFLVRRFDVMKNLVAEALGVRADA